MFEQGLAAGTMQCYFALSSQFRTQDEPAFCGLGTLVMVLNALGVDPGTQWKGVWRWFSEEALDCCKPLDEVRKEGITLDEFSCLAICNGLSVTTVRHGEFALDQLRAVVIECSRRMDKALVFSYDRQGVGQAGSGHFSPLGGYNEAEDLVLVLDTARFKYPPHWIKLHRLHGAMEASDAMTGRSRGYLVMERGDTPALALRLFAVGTIQQNTARRVRRTLQSITNRAAFAGDGPPPLSAIVKELDLDLLGVIWSMKQPEDSSDVMHANAAAAAEVVAAVEQLRLFSAVKEARRAGDVAPNPPVWLACCSAVVVRVEHVTTVLLYSLSDDLVARVLPAANEPLETMPAVLRDEIALLRRQFSQIGGCGDGGCCGASS